MSNPRIRPDDGRNYQLTYHQLQASERRGRRQGLLISILLLVADALAWILTIYMETK